MSLIAELKRRNVFRVGVAYAIVAWLLVEDGSYDDFSHILQLPDWTITLVTVLGDHGLPAGPDLRLGVRADTGGDQTRSRG